MLGAQLVLMGLRNKEALLSLNSKTSLLKNVPKYNAHNQCLDDLQERDRRLRLHRWLFLRLEVDEVEEEFNDSNAEVDAATKNPSAQRFIVSVLSQCSRAYAYRTKIAELTIVQRCDQVIASRSALPIFTPRFRLPLPYAQHRA